MNKYKLADWYDILIVMSFVYLCGCGRTHSLAVAVLDSRSPSCVRAAPMAPNKQAVPMKGARHTALSAKTTIKKQAQRTVLRSTAAQAAGRSLGRPGPGVSVPGSKGALLDTTLGLAGLAVSTVEFMYARAARRSQWCPCRSQSSSAPCREAAWQTSRRSADA